jgi:HD-GYP domain-containing protein (c-di-GMP phosphodiesterase class II)
MRAAPVGSLDTLLETLDYRRPAVAAHSRRVAVFARQLGVVVALPDDDLRTLVAAALIHDAGTLMGDREAGDLFRLQAWCGLPDDVDDLLWYAARRFEHHRHAPVAARLLAVAHAYDELTAPREYHVPLSPESARMAIAREAGRRFCPAAVNALIAAGLERVSPGRDVRDVSSMPETRVAPETVRAAGMSPMTIDYRLVTTS